MATTKAYTDLEQSKKLAEILPLESADMYYECTKEKPEYNVCVGRNIAIIHNLFSYRNGYTIPCWSLATLLGILPCFSEPTAFSSKVSIPSLVKTENGYHLSYVGDYTINLKAKDIEAPMEIIADNPVDACVDMIEKLHELQMF